MTQALRGKHILVTRPAAQAAPLAERITALGGMPVLFPLLEIGPAKDMTALHSAADEIGEYAFIIFISPNAVEFGLPILRAPGAWPNETRAAAIGPSTAAALAEQGIARPLVPRARFDSEGLLALDEFAPEWIVGRKVLIVRGNGGRELLAESLGERGAVVRCATCYHRSAPSDASRVVSLLRNRRLDALTVSSSEGLRNLLALLDTDATEQLLRLPVFVPHQRIVETAKALGLQRVVLTAPADAGIIEGLCSYNWLHHE